MINYLDILKNNIKLLKSLTGKDFNIVVLSNVVVNQLKEILEYTLRKEGLKAKVEFGTYNNILQDSLKYKDVDAIIIFWEGYNITAEFLNKAEILDNKGLEEIIGRIKTDIDFVIENLKTAPVLLFNIFANSLFEDSDERKNLTRCCLELNKYLDLKTQRNLKLINLNPVIENITREKAFNKRYFLTSKAPYTVEFFFEYSSLIKPIFRAITGKVKKILIVDCDNTLWKGIIGEDGADGIAFNSATKDGQVFQKVQIALKELKGKGVLLAICSKNNEKDVLEVFEKHPEMPLKFNDFVCFKINWSDKVSNIKTIAKELNIGLDSMIFLDDSEFEINFINEYLPEVKTFLVPQNHTDYESLIIKINNEFYFENYTKEDKNRTQMYYEQSIRKNIRSTYTTIVDYLKSLCVKVLIEREFGKNIERIAQLTNKTNQFNSTAIRYSETQIEEIINSNDNVIYSFSVSDIYGEYGRTGLIIINFEGKNAYIENFLMSCRILSRNIEFVFFDFLILTLKKYNTTHVFANYIRTLKNSQIENFYEMLGFTTIEENENKKTYKLEIENYKFSGISYIEINDGK